MEPSTKKDIKKKPNPKEEEETPEEILDKVISIVAKDIQHIEKNGTSKLEQGQARNLRDYGTFLLQAAEKHRKLFSAEIQQATDEELLAKLEEKLGSSPLFHSGNDDD